MKIVKKYKIVSDSVASGSCGSSVDVIVPFWKKTLFNSKEDAFAEIDRVYGNRFYVIEIYKKE